MRNPDLQKLNFEELIDYKKAPRAQRGYYNPPLDCRGFCVSCEEKSILKIPGNRLKRTSHGCDSEDFETVLGAMPTKGSSINRPIMFLFRDPSKDSGLNQSYKEFHHRGQAKEIPYKIYYSAQNLPDKWPESPAEIPGGDFYGPFVAYLANLFSLKNIYITNFAKCVSDDDKDTEWLEVSKHCSRQFLIREIEFFQPELVVCFGGDVEAGFSNLLKDKPAYVKLWHPGYTKTIWNFRFFIQ